MGFEFNSQSTDSTMSKIDKQLYTINKAADFHAREREKAPTDQLPTLKKGDTIANSNGEDGLEDITPDIIEEEQPTARVAEPSGHELPRFDDSHEPELEDVTEYADLIETADEAGDTIRMADPVPTLTKPVELPRFEENSEEDESETLRRAA